MPQFLPWDVASSLGVIFSWGNGDSDRLSDLGLINDKIKTADFFQSVIYSHIHIKIVVVWWD